MAKHQVLASRSDQPGWLPVLDHCMRQARAWRVPPRWSACDWCDELQAEGAAAAIQAECVYDPGRGVPLGEYIRLCVWHHLLKRWHKEWSYALRWICIPELLEHSLEDVPCSPSESDDLHVALARLIESDRRLIDRLYWREESEFEVGSSLGISQQAVSKRKHSVLRKLRRLLNRMESTASGSKTPSGTALTEANDPDGDSADRLPSRGR
jgi:DNA-directed RNA polymerase specialized sigma24 family protein